MKKTTLLAAVAAASALYVAAPAMADEGRFQVKVLGTGVMPSGKITDVKKDLIGLPAGSQTKANDNVVPTAAIEYYVTPEFSVETICCLTQHHVNGRGGLAGANMVNHVMILPATVTLKYHLNAGPIRPYVGVGPALFFIIDEKPGTTARSLGATSLKMSNEFGVAVQGGFDVPLNAENKYGITVDAKKYWVDTTLHVKAGATEVLTTKHKLDPWVVSGGVYFRF